MIFIQRSYGNDWPKFRYIRNQFAICQFKETDKKIEIELAAPGQKKEDF
jgi:hypothetical protein